MKKTKKKKQTSPRRLRRRPPPTGGGVLRGGGIRKEKGGVLRGGIRKEKGGVLRSGRRSTDRKILPLNYQRLRNITDPNQFKFDSTDEIREIVDFLGQDRAIEAVNFGLGIKQRGYNLYAMGPSGIGKHSVIKTLLQEEAKKHKVPSDWCYIYNFEDVKRPLALELPPGYGNQLRQDMEILVEDLQTYIPFILEGDEFHARMKLIGDEIALQQEKVLKQLEAEAKKEGLALVSSPQGFAIVPMNDKGEALTPTDFKKMTSEEKEEKEKIIAKFTERLSEVLKQIPKLYKERKNKEKIAQKEFILAAVEHLIDDLRAKYEAFPAVIDYLNKVQEDVVLNVKDFIKTEANPSLPFMAPEKPTFNRYQVNVLVDNSQTQGVPVIYEDHPSYANLICRIEHIAQFGTLFTDFTLIRPGSLHKANGGYLILDALKILQKPFVWEGLKRALYTNKITLETPERMLGLISTGALEPMPIPLNIKVVLLGNRHIYYSLCAYDPDFCDLFKVAVDFEEQMPRTKKNNQRYAQLIGTIAKNRGMLPLTRHAVATIMDQSVRIAQDTEKLTTHVRSLKEIIEEANYYALQSNDRTIHPSHVKEAVEAQIHRLDRVRHRIYEQINREIILIDTNKAVIGQINALVVISIGAFNFGHPTRITAKVRNGRGEVIDIQREVKLGGPIHSKGVLILAGFLGGRFLTHQPLTLSASLVFEQTYGMIEGDSASVAELCAILSALAEAPIRQNLAVTGAINQLGEVQAIGGVNEKIEGFFDICKEKGLTGDQGVLIPKSNIQHLMLREDVVRAAKAKKFHIYPIETVDEAITLLTGVKAGEKDKNCHYPKDSINGRVEKKLLELAQKPVQSLPSLPKKKLSTQKKKYRK